MNKNITIDDIKERIKNISESYKEEATGGYISGDGPIPCDILFVGEAPGKTEVSEGKPFVGMAGKTFEGFLNSIDLTRSKVRITNTCFFRPIKIKESKTGRESISNRTPKPSEIELFREVLDEEIFLVNPKIIVTLGNTPLKRLTNFKAIGECHGELYFNEELKKHIFPMYHPSSLTYNRSEDFKTIYEEDWQKLKAALKSI
ncbi:uracil-DNA glycosylase [Clostridium simiarum]|uniref:uracil-DNA glycosylase n=1 Tax=Clostridium simiarum TaxID=2841506 RepID=UPI001FE38927|nr:uracil-DNA glycosylase [Clostridium simiarum]